MEKRSGSFIEQVFFLDRTQEKWSPLEKGHSVVALYAYSKEKKTQRLLKE
jgi:hypothetical protein